nr:hypothetical protein Iba_chr03aCG4410 [Ipomoea batatas]
MSDTGSQNISARDYDDVVETTPTDMSSADSTRSPREVGTIGGRRGAGGPRCEKSPRVVISHLHDELPRYSPTTREALLTNLPPRPTASEVVSVPALAQPSSSQPSASTGGDFIPLNSDDVRNHPCLLTVSELEETKTLLTRRVEFQTRRMVIERCFAPAPSGPKKPRPKVTLGGNKAAPSTEAATVTPRNFN